MSEGDFRREARPSLSQLAGKCLCLVSAILLECSRLTRKKAMDPGEPHITSTIAKESSQEVAFGLKKKQQSSLYKCDTQMYAKLTAGVFHVQGLAVTGSVI